MLLKIHFLEGTLLMHWSGSQFLLVFFLPFSNFGLESWVCGLNKCIKSVLQFKLSSWLESLIFGGAPLSFVYKDISHKMACGSTCLCLAWVPIILKKVPAYITMKNIQCCGDAANWQIFIISVLWAAANAYTEARNVLGCCKSSL